MGENELLAIAERVEALSGQCLETDTLIAEAAYKGRWPLDCYNGLPINYDPRLWMERYSFTPTGSLDDAMSLVPEDSFWRVGHDGEGSDPAMFKAIVSVQKEGYIAITFRTATAETAALALCSAALRARAFLWLASLTPTTGEGEGE